MQNLEPRPPHTFHVCRAGSLFDKRFEIRTVRDDVLGLR